jgi:hypothetical protein
MGIREMKDYAFQHEGKSGVIVTDIKSYIEDDGEVGDDVWIEVRWENGYQNSYAMKYLIPISDEGEDMSSWDFARLQNDPARHKKKEVKSKEFDYSHPMLAGTRVCLNPSDKRRYNTIMSSSHDTAGYVLDNMLDEVTLRDWNKRPMSDRLGWVHNIQFDNGVQLRIAVKDLLPVDAPSKDVLKFYFYDGTKKTCFTDDLNALEKIDEMVILQRIRLNKTEYWNDEWRKKILDRL